ncbi:uncharacterized protein LOC141912384 [Tubulanus polymorphus]|uniref:uncharacterized protein LOC141912384 n=1 Tax=Tubulanus polymorphus TaxID=672921 RepID=UPI003DA32343
MGAGCSGGQLSSRNVEKSVVNSLIENIPSFKIILVGDPEVGKSSVFKRYMKNQFDSTYAPNKQVSIHNVVRKINIPENTVVAVTMWDLPGREDMDLRKTYYRDADAAIVVVDITDIESIEMAGTWKHEISNNVTVKQITTIVDENGQETKQTNYVKPPLGSIPVILFGNKYDLIDQSSSEAKDENEVKEKMLKAEETCDAKNAESIKEDKIDETDKQNDILGVTKIPETYRKDGNVPDEFFINDPLENSKLVEKNNNVNQNADYDEDEKAAIEDERKEENLPACVQLLQEIEKAYGFISSFHCSAKSAEGNIDIAVQALIRHLLRKKGTFASFDKKKTSQESGEKLTIINDNHNKRVNAKPQRKLQNRVIDLENVGITELDDLFVQCHVPLEMAVKFKKNLKRSLKYFKQECLLMGVVDDEHCSLEDCIFSLRTMLGDEKLLIANEGDNFIKLEVHGLTEELDDNIQKVLSHFNDKFGMVCQTILRDSPAVSCFLEKTHNLIKVRGEEIIENYTNMSADDTDQQQQQQRCAKPNIAALVRKIDANRAKIMHAQELIHLNVEQVEKTAKKVQTSLMW